MGGRETRDAGDMTLTGNVVVAISVVNRCRRQAVGLSGLAAGQHFRPCY